MMIILGLILILFIFIIFMALFIWIFRKMIKIAVKYQPKYERNNNTDEFNKFYEEICNEYKEYGDEINNYNKKINKQHKKAPSIVQMVICFILILLSGFISPFLCIALIIVSFIILVKITQPIGENQNLIKSEYKERIIKKLIKKYSENLEYYPEKGLTREEYEEASFNDYGQTISGFSSEDLIMGRISNNCQMKMSEVRVIAPSTEDSGVNYVFYGLFAKIELLYDLDMSFVIEGDRNIRKSDIGNYKLQMDSTEFEKYYDVHTNDKISTLRIFTSDTMQRLVDFINMTNVLPEISLHKNNLYIRFSTGDVFEPKVENFAEMNVLDKENIRKTYNMVNIIFELIEKISNDILEFEK